MVTRLGETAPKKLMVRGIAHVSGIRKLARGSTSHFPRDMGDRLLASRQGGQCSCETTGRHLDKDFLWQFSAAAHRRAGLSLAKYAPMPGSRTRFAPTLQSLEVRALLSTFVVTNASDSGSGRCAGDPRRSERLDDRIREQSQGPDDHAYERRPADQSEPQYERPWRGELDVSGGGRARCSPSPRVQP